MAQLLALHSRVLELQQLLNVRSIQQDSYGRLHQALEVDAAAAREYLRSQPKRIQD